MEDRNKSAAGRDRRNFDSVFACNQISSAAVPVLQLGRPDPAVVSERYLLLSQVRQPDPLGIRPCADTTEQKRRDADTRFKLLPIFAALLLLFGCGGARTLADVSGCGQWSRVQIIEWYEHGGSAGTQLPADSLSPNTLRELLGSTYVRRSYASMELPVPCVQIFLTADDGALFPLAVGENGRVILSDHSGSAAKDTYWKTDSPALYRSLLSAAGTES